jgi:hypothetical protein
MATKRPADDAAPAPAGDGAASRAPAPFVLTLRDIEVPKPPTQEPAPPNEGLVRSDAEQRPEPYLGDPDAERAAQRQARRAQVRRERQRDASTTDAAPGVLVLSADARACEALCEQLRAFGFSVQRQSKAPSLPAPWPFVAVFVAPPVQAADGGDAIDLCHQVRESSRLPGEKKPVLVLAAPQLSATDRVRAGLAGCNEILLGPPTRGTVAQLLEARGVALPSDARR